MIPEVYSFGQAYWQTGLTSPSQRHHAILCLGHYLWYGDEEAGVPQLFRVWCGGLVSSDDVSGSSR
ncbi:hypothetical protein BH10CYA1_BH10CYA1_23990 [soil metagenome]